MVFQFQLSQNHIDYQKNISDFLEKNKDLDVNTLFKNYATEGYMSIPGLENSKAEDYLSLTLSIEELSKKYAQMANSIVELLFAQEVVKRHARPECRENCLKKISTLDLKVNVLISEPGNYSINNLKTKIEKTAKGYSITGTKIFAPENSNADKYLVVGRLYENDKSSLAIVPVETNQIKRISKEINYASTSIKVDLAEINIEIPEDKIVLNIDDDLKAAMSLWRTLIAASAIGLAHSNIITAMEVVKTTKDSDNLSLSSSQAIQFALADVYSEIEGARLVTYYSSAMIDANTPSVKFSTIAKVQATEAVVFTNSQSANLIGNIGNAYNEEYLQALQLAYNRQIKDGTTRHGYNTICEEALAKR